MVIPINLNLCSLLHIAPHFPCANSHRYPNCEVDLCQHVVQIKEAIHLVRLGARAGLVCQLTGLDKAPTNRLYRQMLGTTSPPGQMPFSDTWYRENDLRMLQATFIWRLYRKLENSGRSPARVLIDVYEVYTGLVREPLLDFTRAVFATRLIAMDLWEERTCNSCSHHFLDPVDSRRNTCPGCRLYLRYRCHQCGSPLTPQTKGRRRTQCNRCANASNGKAHQ
ncbi:MAG: hypothetical protein IPM20_00080 [Gammaproteobacteria bacterium]|nr:hypothetical protein [Gammaproteobacteria bacterium]